MPAQIRLTKARRLTWVLAAATVAFAGWPTAQAVEPSAVARDIAVTTTSLPDALLDRNYGSTLKATGGSSSYTWSIVGGSLPGGLKLYPSGSIQGRPTHAGPSSFTAQVTDSTGRRSTGVVTLTVQPLTVTTTSLPSGEVGASYSKTLHVSAGTFPYVWSALSDLPVGLKLSPSGVLSGKPSKVGEFTLFVRVADEDGHVASRQLPLTVKPIPPPATPLDIMTQLPERGTVGKFYAIVMQAIGGSYPYTWKIVEGTLPAGLKLYPSGSIQGRPTVDGRSSFTVQVTDSRGRVQTGPVWMLIVRR